MRRFPPQHVVRHARASSLDVLFLPALTRFAPVNTVISLVVILATARFEEPSSINGLGRAFASQCARERMVFSAHDVDAMRYAHYVAPLLQLGPFTARLLQIEHGYLRTHRDDAVRLARSTTTHSTVDLSVCSALEAVPLPGLPLPDSARQPRSSRVGHEDWRGS